MFKKIKHVMREHVFSRVSKSLSGDTLLYGLITFFAIIGPLFFIPTRAFPIIASKGTLIFLVGSLGLLIYGIQTLRNGTLVIPRNKLFIALGLLILTSSLGALLSSGFGQSFLGYGFEVTSTWFIIVFALMIFLAYFVVNSYERIAGILGGMTLVAVVLVGIHVLRYVVGADFLNLGVLGSSTTTLIGSWGDLGMFLGMIVLVCATTLELAGLKKNFKWIIGIMMSVLVLVLLVMNITIVWIILGLVSLLLALYLFSFAYWDTQAQTYKKTERVPWFVLAIFVVSVGALFLGGTVNRLASRHQNMVWNELRPSWGMTLRVAKQSLVHNFATGYGPNSFNSVWSLVKPVNLSGNSAARAGFDQGVGFVPTQIATNGIMGAILWVIISVGILGLLIQKTRQGFASALERYFAIGIGSSILYLGILAWVALPGAYLLIVLAVLLGSFMALFRTSAEQRDYVISFIKDPRASFFGILGVTLLIVATVFLAYGGIRKTLGAIHYSRGMVALAQGNPSGANTEITQAVAYANNDGYHRQLAGFALSDVGQIVTTPNAQGGQSKQVEQILGVALAHARAATTIRPLDYKNWVLLGDVYRSMVSLGVTDAADRAQEAYTEAQKKNPHDATMVLSLAQLAIAQKNTEQAMTLIKESLAQYPTADAYTLQASLELSQQKIVAATASLKKALGVTPYDAELLYQYALISIKQKNYTEAIGALQRAILINRSYGAAYVYLGYVYEKTGDMERATQAYDYVTKQFPGAEKAIASVKQSQIDSSPDPVPLLIPSETDQKDTTKKPVAPAVKR